MGKGWDEDARGVQRPRRLSDGELDAVVSEAKRVARTDVVWARGMLMLALEPELAIHARRMCASVNHGANDFRLCHGPSCPVGFSIAEQLLEGLVYGSGNELGNAITMWPETMPFRQYFRGVVRNTATDTLRQQNGTKGIIQNFHADDKSVLAIADEFVRVVIEVPSLSEAMGELGLDDAGGVAQSILRGDHLDASHTNDGPIRDDVRIARWVLKKIEPTNSEVRAVACLNDAVEKIGRKFRRFWGGHVLAGRHAKQTEHADAPKPALNTGNDGDGDRWDDASRFGVGAHSYVEVDDQARLEELLAAINDGNFARLGDLSTERLKMLRVERNAKFEIENAALVPLNDPRVIDRGATLLLNGNAPQDAAGQALTELGYDTKAMISRDLVNAIKRHAYQPSADTRRVAS